MPAASQLSSVHCIIQATVVWARPPIFTVDLVFREGEGRLGFRPRLEDVEAAALGGLDCAVNSATGIPKAGSTDGKRILAIAICILHPSSWSMQRKQSIHQGLANAVLNELDVVVIKSAGILRQGDTVSCSSRRHIRFHLAACMILAARLLSCTGGSQHQGL